MDQKVYAFSCAIGARLWGRNPFESMTMNKHREYRFPKPVRILSIEEALEQGSTPSELRTLSRCLERIAKRGYQFDDFIGSDAAYNHPAVNRKNAVLLRNLAKDLTNGGR